jgi:glutamate/tyrosine decarboxylase-like PLP-dependent enzyme
VRASQDLGALAAGIECADSWATDAHKWLNTPYDCGIALTAHRAAHRRAMEAPAAYRAHDDLASRAPASYTPELSRRARGFAVWAALRQLGRCGVADLVERSCALARQFAAELGAIPGVEILNDVRINQLVVRFQDPAGQDDDAHTSRVLRRIEVDGTCLMSGTVWRGVTAMRISVSNWSTDARDVHRSVEAVARAHREATDAAKSRN